MVQRQRPIDGSPCLRLLLRHQSLEERRLAALAQAGIALRSSLIRALTLVCLLYNTSRQGGLPLRQFDEWCAAMKKSIEGKATLRNIARDCQKRRVPKAALRRLTVRIGELWANRSQLDALPEPFLHSAVIEDPGMYLCQDNSIPRPVQCSRVMDVQDLVENNLELSKLPILLRGRLSERQVRALEKFGTRSAARGEMRTGSPFAWVTKTRDLGNLLSSFRKTEDKAHAARVCLGLLHYQKDQHLVEVQYPVSGLNGAALGPPTTLEGGPSIVYRSHVAADGWGRAVNLENLAQGLPEAVHTPIPFNGDFNLRSIGKLPPMKHAFNWRRFLSTLTPRWNKQGKAILQGYVSK